MSKGAVARKEHRTAGAAREASATTLRRSKTWSPGSFRRALLLSRGSRGDRRGSARSPSSMTAEREQAATSPHSQPRFCAGRKTPAGCIPEAAEIICKAGHRMKEPLASWAVHGRHRWDRVAGGAPASPPGLLQEKGCCMHVVLWAGCGAALPRI